MKKILTFFICIIATGNVWAERWKIDGNCARDRRSNHKRVFVCGKTAPKECSGMETKKADHILYASSGYCVHYEIDANGNRAGESVRICCCNGVWTEGKTTDQTVGVPWPAQEGNDVTLKQWYNKYPETENQLEGGGICFYEKRIDMCGTDISNLCTVPTACSGNLILRNGECVSPCPDGQAWESETSNTCVECPTTNHMGIITNNVNCKVAKKRQEAIEDKLEELNAPETLKKFREWGAGTKTAMTDTQTEYLTKAFNAVSPSLDPGEHFRQIATPSCQVALQGFDNKICRKCTEGQEFFIPEEEDPNSESEEDNTNNKIKETTGICVKKSQTKAVSPEVLRKCGLCDDLDTTQACLKCYAENGANSTECSKYKKECLITY